MASKTVKDLHDHLKSTGTGKSKLEAVKGCASMTAAVAVLAASFPGTLAKAKEYLGDEMPEVSMSAAAEAAGDAAFRAAIIAGKSTKEAQAIAQEAAAQAAKAPAPAPKPAPPKPEPKGKDEPAKPVPPVAPKDPPKSN